MQVPGERDGRRQERGETEELNTRRSGGTVESVKGG